MVPLEVRSEDLSWAPIYASVWLRGLRGALVKTVLPSVCSCSYGLGFGVPGGSWVVRAVSREHPSLVLILTIPFLLVGIMIVFIFN